MSYTLQAHRELVGRQIRKARKQAGLSHDQLAVRVGTSRQHLIKLEKGLHLPRPEMLAAIARETSKTEAFFESDDDEESASMSLGEAIDRMLERAITEKVERALHAVKA